MIKRTTIEIDERLLERAKQALGSPTTRATVEEALRRAAEQADDEHQVRAEHVRAFLESLPVHVDVDILATDDMWR